MAWKRFPVPTFDYAPLKGRAYERPATISSGEAQKIVAGAANGQADLAGGYFVEPDPALLGTLDYRGEFQDMAMCVLPDVGAKLVGNSYAWFNQRAFILDANSQDANTVFNWRTPRPMNTLLGPEEGVVLEHRIVFLLSGRIVSDYTRGNRVMIDDAWTPPEGRAGFRVIAACDDGEDNFHESCFEFSWAV